MRLRGGRASVSTDRAVSVKCLETNGHDCSSLKQRIKPWSSKPEVRERVSAFVVRSAWYFRGFATRPLSSVRELSSFRRYVQHFSQQRKMSHTFIKVGKQRLRKNPSRWRGKMTARHSSGPRHTRTVWKEWLYLSTWSFLFLPYALSCLRRKWILFFLETLRH